MNKNSQQAKKSAFQPKHLTAFAGMLTLIGTFFPWATLVYYGKEVVERYPGLSQTPGMFTAVIGVTIIFTSLFIRTEPGKPNFQVPSLLAIATFLIDAFWAMAFYEKCFEEFFGNACEYKTEIGTGFGYALSMFSLFLVFVFGLIHNSKEYQATLPHAGISMKEPRRKQHGDSRPNIRIKTPKDSEITYQDKKWLIVLGVLILIVATSLITSFFIQQPKNTSTDQENNHFISGYSREYLPTTGELPSGFIFVDDGPIDFSGGGNLYGRVFSNSDLILEGREVNINYLFGVFDNATLAQEVLDRLHEGTPYFEGIERTQKDYSIINNFSNVDSIRCLFVEERTELNTFAVNYIIFIRYQNTLTMVTVSAPVNDFDSNHTKQVKTMLGQAALYYTNLVTKRLPEQILINVPQPPFGAIAPDIFQSNPVLFSDDFEDETKTMQAWRIIDGDWEIRDGTLFCRATVDRCLIFGGDPTMKNYRLSLDVKGNEGAGKFVFVGVIEDEHLYRLNLRANPYDDLVLTEQLIGVGNTDIKISPYPNERGHWYHLEIITFENSLQIFVDDQLVMVASNLSKNLTGQIALGLRYSSAKGAGITSVYFDNVLIEPYE